MIKQLLSTVLLTALALQANSLNAETAWKLTDQDAMLDEKPTSNSWGGKKMKILPIEGKFTIIPNGGHSLGRYVDVSPETPYLVWRITEANPLADGYKGTTGPRLTIDSPTQTVGQASDIQTGTFMIDVTQTSGKYFSPRKTYMAIDLHRVAITYDYIMMTDAPENLITITSPAFDSKEQLEIGDEITFRVTLQEPAEDVQFRLFNSYTMPKITLNGEHVLQAKPEDDAQKIWSRTVKIKSLSGGKAKDGAFAPGRVLVRATILGGALKEPLWTSNPIAISATK